MSSFVSGSLSSLSRFVFSRFMCEETPQVQRLYHILQKCHENEKFFTERFPLSEPKKYDDNRHYVSFYQYQWELCLELDKKGWRTGLPAMDDPKAGEYQDRALMNALVVLLIQSESPNGYINMRMIVKDYQKRNNQHHAAIEHILSHLDDLESSIQAVNGKTLADLHEQRQVLPKDAPLIIPTL